LESFLLVECTTETASHGCSPLSIQFTVTADRLRDKGYSVAEEAGDGWLLAQRLEWLQARD
jgi:biotin operon repressor